MNDHNNYWIPKNYYHPAMFALQLFRKSGQFNSSVDAAYYAFTADLSSPDYIPPSKLNRNKLSQHLLKYIANS